jgi:hypothetical protein
MLVSVQSIDFFSCREPHRRWFLRKSGWCKESF